jgi:hypothetical protein
MRRILLIAGLLLGGCQRISEPAAQIVSPPAAYAHFGDRVAARMLRWGIPWKLPCTEKSKGNAATLLLDDQCYKFLPPKRYQGLWRDDAEGPRFCPAPARECTKDSPGSKIRFEAVFPTVRVPKRGFGALYRVDVIARQTAHRGIYNHLQPENYEEEIFVDRMIAMEVIKPGEK